MATSGLEDKIGHFLPRHKLWLKVSRAWYMIRKGQEVRSWTDYILVTEFCMLQNMTVQDTQNNAYIDLVLGCFRGAAPTAHSHYLRKRTHFSIKSPTTLDGVNCMFNELWRSVNNPPRL